MSSVSRRPARRENTGAGPKYLLNVLGAEHVQPYSDQEPQLGIVEGVTTAFLDGYSGVTPSAR